MRFCFILLLVLGGIATDDQRFVLALPVLINAVLLIEFGATLRAGSMPMIERLARMQETSLDEAQQRHCRHWTGAWCAFFLLNGGTAAVHPYRRLAAALTHGQAFGAVEAGHSLVIDGDPLPSEQDV